MNARTHVFEFTCESGAVDDIVSSVFETVLFYRSLGKFRYHGPSRYSVGSVGFEDVDLRVLELTHVRCSSPQLQRHLRAQLQPFLELMRPDAAVPPQHAQISLEFYQKKRAKWPFPSESVPWEVWTLQLDTVNVTSERERRMAREKLADSLAERLIGVAKAMTRPQYLPQTPAERQLDLVFDTSVPDVQPYLHRVHFHTSRLPSPSVGHTVKKLLKETLTM